MGVMEQVWVWWNKCPQVQIFKKRGYGLASLKRFGVPISGSRVCRTFSLVPLSKHMTHVLQGIPKKNLLRVLAAHWDIPCCNVSCLSDHTTCHYTFAILTSLSFPLPSPSHPGAQAHTEVLADNRRMAEMLATTDGDSKEMAGLLERLSEDRKKLQRECSELRRRRVATEEQGRGSGGGEELSEVRLLWGERDY